MAWTLFVVFLVLKITEAVEISWFWVFFPLWIGGASVLLFMLISALVALIGTTIMDNF